MTETSVKLCSCTHPYQDKKYGKGKRVHNKGSDDWKCTVCGSSKSQTGAERDKRN